MWSQIIDILNQHQRFVISSHTNPDCDALGSELGLAHHLQSLGKQVHIINTDPVLPNYQFLDPDGLIQQYDGSQEQRTIISQAEVILVLDASGGWERLGKVGDLLGQADAISVCIDHHPDDVSFVQVAVVDTGVVAVGELIFDLIMSMTGQMTPLMAQAIYAAILTDSGYFRFPKTSPKTHRITAQLLEYGADPSHIFSLIYQHQPYSKVQLQGYVLQHIKLAAEGQVAYITLTQKILKHYQTDARDLNAFSNLPQAIDGVRIAIMTVEMPDRRVKISLRSDGSVGVNGLAGSLGGGGHFAAAGATSTGSLEAVTNQVVEQACLLVIEEKVSWHRDVMSGD